MGAYKNLFLGVLELYDSGMTPDRIAEVTGLDLEQVMYTVNLSGEYPDTVECEDVPF